jgi:hypothetical protein
MSHTLHGRWLIRRAFIYAGVSHVSHLSHRKATLLQFNLPQEILGVFT